jgi:hypothetical protein
VLKQWKYMIPMRPGFGSFDAILVVVGTSSYCAVLMFICLCDGNSFILFAMHARF